MPRKKNKHTDIFHQKGFDLIARKESKVNNLDITWVSQLLFLPLIKKNISDLNKRNDRKVKSFHKKKIERIKI